MNRLSVDEQSEMAQKQLGDWLLAETGGSPFFVTEMLQMLQEQEMLAGASGAGGGFVMDATATLQRIHSAGAVPMPPNVRGVILARLAHLSEQASALLLAGAVIGRQCSFRRLCQVARLNEFDSLPALAAGDAAMSLHAFADAAAHYRSALELADRVSTTSAQRCHLCTQYGRALELSGQYTAALAHYEVMAKLATQTGDRPLALAALLAELAEARGDSTAASQWKATARDTIQAIADQTSDPRLRAIFLDQSRVRQLLPPAD